MSRQITQPVNQVRLTNVAVVRMNRHGKRFEVACYRNKILNYRQKIETDLSEVLQTDRVFTNVSKGLFAPSKDLQTAFGTTDQDDVCRMILDKGQIQVSDMERSATIENTAREVANMVATKCVHPVSNRPYTNHQIRDAMKQSEFSVQPTSARSVKQQFLDCVRAIQNKGILDIQRAKMELALVFSDATMENNSEELMAEQVVEMTSRLELEGQAIMQPASGHDPKRLYFLIDPSKYRNVDCIAKEFGSTLEIIRQTVTQEGDTSLDVDFQLNQNELPAPTSPSRGSAGAGATGASANMSTVQRRLANLNVNNNHNKGGAEYGDNDNGEDYENIVSTRKKNKKAMKKSKKAKRREKEDAALRQERIDAEKTRREEREYRLRSTATATADNNKGSVAPLSDNKSDKGAGASADEALRSCNTCGGSFTPAEYRAHFRSDWHRYNMKLKLKGIAAVSEKEFLMIDEGAFF